jgi:hypothetical protein
MKFPLTIIFLLITTFLFAQQNLVLNSSFDDTVVCPNSIDQVQFSTGWNKFGNGTPDYFNSCAPNTPGNSVSVPHNDLGYQIAANGNAYCGFYSYVHVSLNQREYIGRQMTIPLIVGQKYFASIKVSLANIDSSTITSCNCASNKIGLLFTTQPYFYDIWNPNSIKNFAHIYTNSIISDTLNWTIIKGSFIADSAYQYIIIGNFFSDINTDTIVLKGSMCNAYYFVDDVCVSIDSLTCNNPDAINENNIIKNSINIFPNPASNELTIDFALLDKSYFELYDMIGAKRKAVALDYGSQTKRIDLSDIDSGLYFYSVVDRKGNRIKAGKLIVIK